MTRKATLGNAALAAAALTLACSTTPNQTYKTLQLQGVYDLARVKDLIFVVVADHDLLHVLDVSKAQREFVRAPNPIEPLAIPVLQHPVNLVLDVHYDANGAEVPGPYLYVQNPSLAELSVVHACALTTTQDGTTSCNPRDPSVLKEVVRLTTSGPVTAVSAAGAKLPGDSSTLYYATRDGNDAYLWSVSLPATGLAEAGAPSATQLLKLPATTISALQVLPAPNVVVVATRDDDGTTGATFVLDTSTSTQTLLHFPAPVRMLRTNPAAGNLAAGTVAYGVLDESTCGGADACRGIVAVNTFTTFVFPDAAGAPMMPIRWGDALPISVELVPEGIIPRYVWTSVDDPLPGDPEHKKAVLSLDTTAKLQLLGLATLSTGGVGVFNAGRIDPSADAADPKTSFRVLDQDPGDEFPASTDPVLLAQEQFQAIAYQDASGLTLPYQAGIAPESITVGSGTVQTETLFATYQGVVPGFELVPLDAAAPVPTTYAVDPALLAPCGNTPDGAADPDPQRCVRVRPGDFVELQGGCRAELTVASVGAASFDTSTPPAGCSTGATGYTLRAGGDRPLVVLGTSSGFMGRKGPSPDPFRSYAPIWYRTPDFDPANPTPAAVQFVVSSLPADIQRDYRYVLSVRSGFSPETIFIGTLSNVTDRVTLAGTPGGVAYYLPSGGAGVLFVSYPAAGAIAELLESDTALNMVNIATLHY